MSKAKRAVPEHPDVHDEDGPTEEVLAAANKLISDVELRRSVGFCDRCTAEALLLAAARIGQLHGTLLDDLQAVLVYGYETSAELPLRVPMEETLH